MLLARTLIVFATTVACAHPAAAQTGIQTPVKRESSTEGAQTLSRWIALPKDQKLALQPLAAEWDKLSQPHRRKWISLARNFEQMSAQEQATLHARMAEWARLSPNDRARARFNFAEVQRLVPADERKAKWEAYQALSADERSALAKRAQPTPRGTAASVRPVAKERLVPVPAAALQAGQSGPRIALTPPATRAEAGPQIGHAAPAQTPVSTQTSEPPSVDVGHEAPPQDAAPSAPVTLR